MTRKIGSTLIYWEYLNMLKEPNVYLVSSVYTQFHQFWNGTESQRTPKLRSSYNISGQISIIPKPELRGFCGSSSLNHHLG